MWGNSETVPDPLAGKNYSGKFKEKTEVKVWSPILNNLRPADLNPIYKILKFHIVSAHPTNLHPL